MKAIEVMLLARKDIVRLGLTPERVVSVVESALREHAAGTFEMHPKIGVHPTKTDPANFIHAMPAYLKQQDACGLKWVAGYAKNCEHELPNVTGIQVYNDADTGIPLAVMDCGYLTGLRTAAVSSIIARLAAKPNAQTLALAGCGFEGSMHLWFVLNQIPTIREVRLRDIRPAAMEDLRDRAREYFSGTINLCADNRSCFDGADVIVTCTNGADQLIEPPWFRAGTVGVGIEGGCAYTAPALHQADRFIVDDVALAEYFDKLGQTRVTETGEPDPEFPGGMPTIDATIGEVLTGKKPARNRPQDRVIAIPIGMAICDVALGKLAYESARTQGLGSAFVLS